MTEDNKFTEAFHRAQNELNHDGFVAWLCHAYGSLTSNDRGKDARINLIVLNEAIDSLRKEPSYSKRC